MVADWVRDTILQHEFILSDWQTAAILIMHGQTSDPQVQITTLSEEGSLTQPNPHVKLEKVLTTVTTWKEKNREPVSALTLIDTGCSTNGDNGILEHASGPCSSNHQTAHDSNQSAYSIRTDGIGERGSRLDI
jgi:hypothetical protein